MRRASAVEGLGRCLPLLLALVAALALAGDAWARVGGGQGYSGGGSSGGGYSGGGSGGGDGGALIHLLIWLCLEHPAIGIPLTLVVAGIFIYQKVQHGGQRDKAYRRQHLERARSAPRQRSRTPGRVDLQQVVADDANFSEPLFIDFAQLVYARVQRARGDGDLEPLRPLATDRVRDQLAADRKGLTDVREVIFGATRLVAFRKGPERLRLTVEFETNLTEVRGGSTSQLLRQERWTFARSRGVLSPGPERMRSLDCPSCGSTLEPGTDGRCPNCGTMRTGGATQWVVEALQVVSSRALARPELHLGGGVEPGTRSPTRTDPNLPVQLRALQTRHPAFTWSSFTDTVTGIFLKLQQAWSEQRWELARPYETDALFQTHRFWMERYRKHGLINKLDQVQVRRVEPVKVGQDAFYEAITVRIFASMLDWTQDSSGRVVGGSDRDQRVFSEYWTFIRRIGGKASPEGGGWSADNCPSCGAPLDNVSQAGVCGYCDAKITTGEFDWVLTRIEQDEAYQG